MSKLTLDDAPLNSFHKRLAVFSSGGPFLDGYVLSVIGVALVQATPQLGLSVLEQGLVGAAALVGMFFGGFLGGWLTDKLGRHLLFTVDLIAIIGISVAQAFVQDAWALILLRFVLGIAVGADYPIATSLLTEFIPRKFRAPLLGAFDAMWFVGAALAYLVGNFLLSTPDGWRWLLASAAVPGLIIVLFRIGTPESPRWLVHKGRVDEAERVVVRVLGPGADLSSLGKPEDEVKHPVSALFRRGYGQRMAFVLLFWTCAITPLFAIYTFTPEILSVLNLDGDLDTVGSSVITLMFLIGCVISLLVVNKMGPRQLLIHSFLWAGVAMLLLGIFPEAPTWIILVLFFAYALFTSGSQILQWIYANELFPTSIRGSAVGLGSSLSRVGAAAGTFLVPLSLTTVGVGTTMIIGAAITFVGLIASVLWAPDTRGMALEETASLNLAELQRTRRFTRR